MPTASGPMLFLQPNTPVRRCYCHKSSVFPERVSNKQIFFLLLTELSSEIPVRRSELDSTVMTASTL